MFDVFCSACNRRQLVFPGQVTGIVNAPLGIAVQFRCTCGELAVWTTGPRAPKTARVAA